MPPKKKVDKGVEVPLYVIKFSDEETALEKCEF
jgi:hypothetical protein